LLPCRLVRGSSVRLVVCQASGFKYRFGVLGKLGSLVLGLDI
jgi:hypothetical protein